MSSLFSLLVERSLIVPFLMNLELRLVGAIQIIQLSGSLSESGPRNFGTENNFPSFYVSQKGLAHIYKKRFIFFQLFLLCYKPKLHFGRTEVADRGQKGKIVKRATSPKIQLTEFRFHRNSKVHSLL